MDFKNRPIMDMAGKWVNASGICFGVSVFCCAVYYFGLVNLADIGFGEILFSMLLPLIVGIAFVVLLRCVKLNAAGLYAILGTAVCLLVMIQSFSCGNFLRMFLSIIWYAAAAAVLMFTALGALRYGTLAAAMFALALVVRILAYGLGRLSLTDWVQEISVLSFLAGVMVLPMSFQFRNKK